MTDSRATDTPVPAPTRLDRQIIVLGLVVISGSIMAILDMTIVNVALDTLARDFTTELSTIQWVVTGYMLALGTVIPLTGWAIDRFGAKRIWMLSIVLFVAGSALSGASWSIGSLIAFRVVQGLGGGMLMPTGMAILTMAAGPQRLGRVMSIIGVPMLLGPVLGPVLGGWLVEDVDWRWIFYVNVPVGALALALAAWRIPGGRAGAGSAALDLRGLLLLPPGFVLVIYGLSTATGTGGFGDPTTLAWIVGGIMLIGLFAAHSLKRRERALIDVRLLTDRLGAGRVVPFGIILLLLGTIAYTQVTVDSSYWLLGGSLFVRGMGLGATMMPIMSAAFTTLTKAAVPRASSSLNMIMQLGGSFGSALLAVILSREIADRLPAAPGEATGGRIGAIPDAVRERFAPDLAHAFGSTFWVSFALTVVVIVPALLLPRRGGGVRSDESRESTNVGSAV